MNRESVVFYKGFYEALKELDAETKAAAYDAIISYGLYGEEPECTGIVKALFQMAKPQLDKNNKRYENACKGGEAVKEANVKPNASQTRAKRKPNRSQTEAKQEPNRSQTEANVKPNDNDNDNDNVNDNVNENENESLKALKEKQSKKKAAASAYVDDPRVNDAICHYIEHRKKLRKPMTPHALELLIKHLQELSDSAETQVLILNQSMREGWSDVYPLKTVKGGGKTQPKGSVDEHLMSIINGERTIGGGDISDTG